MVPLIIELNLINNGLTTITLQQLSMTRSTAMISPSEIDQATINTLVGGIILKYHVTREEAQDILQDVLLKLVVWDKNNANTDKYKGSSMRMAIPFIRTAINNRILDDRIQWYTQGRVQYRDLLETLRLSIADPGTADIATFDSIMWSTDMESEEQGCALSLDATVDDPDLMRALRSLPGIMQTAVIGRYILEMQREELLEEYPELFRNLRHISTMATAGLAILREKLEGVTTYG